MVSFISKDGCEPTIKTKYSAGADLVANEDIIIYPQEVVIVKTGVWIDNVSEDIIDSAFLALYPRSSTAKKLKVNLANNVGVIDLDYPDEIGAMLHNFGEYPVSIKKGEPIVQMILTPHLQKFMQCKRKTDERTGGFGSTGSGPEVAGLSTAHTFEDSQ